MEECSRQRRPGVLSSSHSFFRLRSKNIPESSLNRPQIDPRRIPNRSLGPQGGPGGSQKGLKSLPGTLQGPPKTVQGRPKEPPRSPKEAPGDPKGRPRRPRGTLTDPKSITKRSQDRFGRPVRSKTVFEVMFRPIFINFATENDLRVERVFRTKVLSKLLAANMAT